MVDDARGVGSAPTGEVGLGPDVLAGSEAWLQPDRVTQSASRALEHHRITAASCHGVPSWPGAEAALAFSQVSGSVATGRQAPVELGVPGADRGAAGRCGRAGYRVHRLRLRPGEQPLVE